MSKIIAIMLVFVLAASGMVYAQTSTTDNNPATKLGRGILNILDALIEIPGTMMRESTEKGAAAGMTTGLFAGIVNTVVRAIVGVYEAGTFPLPIPSGYEPILDDPKFLSSK